MGKPDFKEIYDSEFDAELCEGYYDGRRVSSPEPGSNRHPAYVHGFMNGRDDIGRRSGMPPRTSRTAEKKRQSLRYLRAVMSD